MIFVLPVYIRAILNAASFASVPDVVKKNFVSPSGNTSSSNWLSSARASVAYAGDAYTSASACSAIARITAGFLCPKFTHISCADKSRYRFPTPSVK